MRHDLSIEASAGIKGRPYHNAECSCGWMAGAWSADTLRNLHAQHAIAAQADADAKALEKNLREAAPALYEALTELLAEGASERAVRKARAALAEARGQ